MKHLNTHRVDHLEVIGTVGWFHIDPNRIPDFFLGGGGEGDIESSGRWKEGEVQTKKVAASAFRNVKPQEWKNSECCAYYLVIPG